MPSVGELRNGVNERIGTLPNVAIYCHLGDSSYHDAHTVHTLPHRIDIASLR